MTNTTSLEKTQVAIQVPASFRYGPLFWLALGTFAVGTEGFMIAAILPRIAGDLAVTLGAAGQLVTVFTLAYAIGSPVLTTLAGSLDRRKLLIGAMIAFAVANIVASLSFSYWTLVFARVLIAFAAGLYVPNANALAAAMAPSERRGRALAIVNGGLTAAVALGVPLGAFVGYSLGWRMNFVGVALLATIAILGLVGGLPRGIGLGLPTTTLRQRFAVLRMPGVLAAVLVTTFWAMGGYTVYTYIAPYLDTVAGLRGIQIGWVLFTWGIAAAVGIFGGGMINDRFGSRPVIAGTLSIMALALISLSLSARYFTPSAALVPVLIAVGIWGVTAWGFFPAQQVRLMGITGLKVAPVILSLNASFMYLGFSMGAAVGAFTLAHGTIADLGWVGGLWVVAALVLYLAMRPPIALAEPGPEARTLSEIVTQLHDLEAKVAALPSAEIQAIKLNLEIVHQNLQQIHLHQESIHQWVVAIGGQVGIKPADESVTPTGN